ncbi:hypothetical protein DPEC_G00207990 [Dallia pectoralis]|uniref:Uncharacterized protein n=1 Tax=Dallia pectoralis TaxID=75939 RepID=A0ACC2G4Q2_DALPE|nr:hypothetical protein DPEC_G00207990 [Dallia pectoralis]
MQHDRNSQAATLPPHRPYDCAIDLLPESVSTLCPHRGLRPWPCASGAVWVSAGESTSRQSLSNFSSLLLPGQKVWLSTQNLHLLVESQKLPFHFKGPLPIFRLNLPF